MVSRIPLPNINDVELVGAIVAERQSGVNRDFFNDIRAEWIERVELYQEQGGNPQFVTTWPLVTSEVNSKKFLTLYNSPQAGAAQEGVLRKLRREHGYQHCPSCGEAGSPDTLDHYLPKKKFPQFAVTVSNLTPMCGRCQRKKGDDVGDAENPKFFIHPYYDEFAAQQLLRLEIIPPFDTPTFELRVCEVEEEAAANIVEHHVRRLDLPKRFRSFFRNRYRRLQRQAQRCRDNDVDLIGFLQITKMGFEEDGRNTWDHVFYFSVMENPELMTYLQVDDLPTYL